MNKKINITKDTAKTNNLNNIYINNNNNKPMSTQSSFMSEMNESNIYNTKNVSSKKSKQNRSISSNKKRKNEDGEYKEKYLKLNAKFESDKNLLVKLRKTTNKLKMTLTRLIKKESLYNDLYEKNNNLIKENEQLYNAFVESEEVRNHNEILISTLQNEVIK